MYIFKNFEFYDDNLVLTILVLVINTSTPKLLNDFITNYKWKSRYLLATIMHIYGCQCVSNIGLYVSLLYVLRVSLLTH